MSVLRVTEGLVEINDVHQGDVEVRGGVAIIRGRVTGDIDIRGGKTVIPGIVDGSVTNYGGHVQISGTVLGSITGSPSQTIVDITDAAQRNFGGWDPIASAQPARQSRQSKSKPVSAQVPSKSSAGRATIFSAVTAALVGAATIVAMAMAGGNTPIDADGADASKAANATVLVVEKN